MNTIFIILGTLGSVFAVVMTVLSMINYKKPRKITAVSTFLSGLISLLSLAALTILGGMSLNFDLGFLLFMAGLFLGYLRGTAVKLIWENGQVIGRNSILFLILWGLSLALSQLLGLFGSPLLASLGLIPVVFTTGLQAGYYGNLFLRRLIMGRKGKDRKGLQRVISVGGGIALLLMMMFSFALAAPEIVDALDRIFLATGTQPETANYSSNPGPSNTGAESSNTPAGEPPGQGLLPASGSLVINCDRAVQKVIDRDVNLRHENGEEGTFDELYESYDIWINMEVDLSKSSFALHYEKHSDEIFSLYDGTTGEEVWHHDLRDVVRTSEGIVMDDGWITGTSIIDDIETNIVFPFETQGSNDFYGFISDDLNTIVHCPLPVTNGFINQEDYKVDFEDLHAAGKDKLVSEWWNPDWCYICIIETVEP